MKRFGEELILTLPNGTSAALSEGVRLLKEEMGCDVITPATFGPDDGFALLKKGDYEFVLGWIRDSGVSIGLRNPKMQQMKEEAMEILRALRAV